MRDDHRRPTREEFTVAGGALVDKIKELVRQGNVRRLIVRRPSGQILTDVPLNAGLGVAAALTLIAPVLTALGAIAALLAQFRIEIERDPGQPRGPYPDDPR
ncbi:MULTISPECIES: DUF4342 domain-containing protein [unclassified Marichromatium]|uniref:DUF4342 domain-containing protein n=1 Tax=unclassified Marichromatium TaxID=2618417 RepID=UPI000F3D0C8C|nr:DUF4342 domain-containing protein [Marichromatium sp. AB32]MBO8086716.1 DUF4342 domain-containing protein [Marichromatium sp.]RNE94773.1 DUF4342 domain-containing protein [Marichromatium sp. AB32]